MSDDRLRLAFGGLHPDRTRQLVERLRPAQALRHVRSRSKSVRVKEALEVTAAARRKQLDVLGIEFVLRGAPRYPAVLADRPDGPDALFVRGSLPDRAGVAVVGTRRCTAYGRRLAEGYGKAIAAAGWPLISGLARGIDGAAHRGTAAGGGIGVAVLGCGLDIAYPPEHAPLGRKLIELGGAVISEYPPGTPPEGWRFPPRNRIISGLSAAVVVVEAGVKGGALITTNTALEQGVAVFAVPGDVDREASRGCNLLIRDGAHPVMDPADLVAELELIFGPVASPASQTVAPEGVPSDGITIDDLAQQLGESAAATLALVTRWEADGQVEREGDRVYVRH